MDEKRYTALMDDETTELTAEEFAAGWHFCNEFDGLLVGPGSHELHCCTCLDKEHPVYATKPKLEDVVIPDDLFGNEPPSVAAAKQLALDSAHIPTIARIIEAACGCDFAAAQARELRAGIASLHIELKAARAHVAMLRTELTEANQICRSMSSIAERKGGATNWEAFTTTLDRVLLRQHQVLHPQRYVKQPTTNPENTAGT